MKNIIDENRQLLNGKASQSNPVFEIHIRSDEKKVVNAHNKYTTMFRQENLKRIVLPIYNANPTEIIKF